MKIPLKYSQDFHVNRLVTEWLEHGKIIVGCDVDDTILPYNESQTKSCIETVDLLKACQEEGIILILNTARQTRKHVETIVAVTDLGLKPISVNRMPDDWRLDIGLSGKIYANIYLDDRGGLPLARLQLEYALKKVKDAREQMKLKSEL